MELEAIRFVDALPGLVWTALPDGQIDFLNQRWCEYTGLSPREASGWGWQTAIFPADLPRLLGQWQSIVASGQPGEMEARLRGFDAKYRWFLFRLSPLAEASATVTKWCGINTEIEDHKQAQAIRANERRLSRIINTIPTTVWSTLPDGSCDFLNQRWLDYTGLTEEEALGWGWTSVIHPDDSAGLVEYWKSCLATGTPVDTEVRMRRHDGAYRWFLLRGAPLRDEAGDIRRWYGTNLDIEDRKQAEEKLRKSELNLREMTETIPEMLWSATPDGKIDYCNGRLLAHTGFAAEEVTGDGWMRLLHSDDVEHTREAWQSCVAAGAPFRVEVRALHAADRAYRWCVVSALPLLDQDGRILKWHGTVVDIHDRKRAEDELRRSEARKTAILDSALDCIVTIDHEGRITEFNPAAERTFGHQRENVLGKLLADVVIPPSLRDGHRQGLTRYLTTGETRFLGRRVELTAIRADGAEFPVEVAITRIPSDGPPSFTGYLRDITNRQRADEELRRNEAALREAQAELAHVARVTTMGELAASIAHEINQPIAGVVINGNACLRWLAHVPEESVQLKEAREALQRIIRDGNRAGEIVSRIRALFKKTGSAKEPLDLNETIREIIVLARSEMSKQRVMLRLELSSDLPRVLGDRVQFQQVMLNLILNAIDAMATVQDRARDLVIRTHSRGAEEVLVTVRDSGIGLHPESVEQVFAAFHTTKPGGLGMGLSISRSIVENHSGRLWATAHEGPGASFCFTLPSQPAPNGPDV